MINLSIVIITLLIIQTMITDSFSLSQDNDELLNRELTTMIDNEFDQSYRITSGDNFLYGLDSKNNRIQIFDELGYAMWGFDLKDENKNKIHATDLAVSDDGVIAVIDLENSMIRLFVFDGRYVGKVGMYGSDKGQFTEPSDSAIYKEKIYVVDKGNNRIQIFDISQAKELKTTNDENGKTKIILQDFDSKLIGEFGSYGSQYGQFNDPTNIAINDDRIYVFDNGNARIQIFDLVGNFLGKFDYIDKNVDSVEITGLEVYENRIYVLDKTKSMIHLFDLNGNFLSYIDSNDLGKPLSPYDFTVHKENGIYVTSGLASGFFATHFPFRTFVRYLPIIKSP